MYVKFQLHVHEMNYPALVFVKKKKPSPKDNCVLLDTLTLMISQPRINLEQALPMELN
jgi:hypothetical protein